MTERLAQCFGLFGAPLFERGHEDVVPLRTGGGHFHPQFAGAAIRFQRSRDIAFRRDFFRHVSQDGEGRGGVRILFKI